MTYLRDAAVVEGASAHLLDRLLARYLPDIVANTPMDATTRAGILATREAIATAARAWESRTMSVDGPADTDPADIAPRWTMTVAQAADLLRVTPRQARRLAERLGHKAGREWVLDRGAVLAERERREGNR